MNTPPPSGAEISPESVPPLSLRPLRGLILALGALTLAFGLPLWDLVSLSLQDDLYSHVLLIPVVSLYFIWLRRVQLQPDSAPNSLVSILAFSAGFLVLASYWMAVGAGVELAREDRLAFQVASWVCLVAGTCAAFLGRRTFNSIIFPLLFLLFMVPFPTAIKEGIELFFQHTSAATAAAFFTVADTPFFRQGTYFQLPGINLEVAPECSGIRSSLALFITSLVAGQLFLRSRFKQVVLALVVIPLGILRNGLRIFVIGELCVHISPDMIHSYIHRQGGPVFFALSLVPFGLLLFFLIRLDRAKAPTNFGSPASPLVASETASTQHSQR